MSLSPSALSLCKKGGSDLYIGYEKIVAEYLYTKAGRGQFCRDMKQSNQKKAGMKGEGLSGGRKIRTKCKNVLKKME